MLNSSSVRIDVNDLLEELREENNTLFKQLLFAQKCQKLLQKYRNNLNNIYINCKCDQSFQNKLIFNDLEIEYKCISEEYSQEFDNNLKVNNNLDNKWINNKTNESLLILIKTNNKVSVNKRINKNQNICKPNNDSNREVLVNNKLNKTLIKTETTDDSDNGHKIDLNEKQLDLNSDQNQELSNNCLKSGFTSSKTLSIDFIV
jgi:hypothetical protein